MEDSEVHLNDTSATLPTVEAVNENVKQVTELPQVIEPEPEAEVIVGNGNIEENSEYSQEDYDPPQHERRVGFDAATASPQASDRGGPGGGRLHRRDTPHHLKNKRITPAVVDKDKVASIIAQALKRKDEESERTSLVSTTPPGTEGDRSCSSSQGKCRFILTS
nr:unnamed protein product [Callosobruchus chinensis]